MASWLLWLCSWLLIHIRFTHSATLNRGQKFQIILTGRPDTTRSLSPSDADVWDIDLFDNSASTISALKASNKFVICYFSAGTAENWRSDYNQFAANDLGSTMEDWPDEKWVRVSSQNVRSIMSSRIKMAADKGCSAIDPDNTDGYSNKNGLNLQQADAVDYLKWMQQEAAQYGMKIGLKNSLDILDTLSSTVDFAVNEQCVEWSECDYYTDFLAAGKPVFHIEYPEPLNAQAAAKPACKNTGVQGLSTVLKDMDLNGETYYCDGSYVDTPLQNGSPPPEPIPSVAPSPRPSPTVVQSSSTVGRPSSSVLSNGPSPPPHPSQPSPVKPQPSQSSLIRPQPSLASSARPQPSSPPSARPQPSPSPSARPQPNTSASGPPPPSSQTTKLPLDPPSAPQSIASSSAKVSAAPSANIPVPTPTAAPSACSPPANSTTVTVTLPSSSLALPSFSLLDLSSTAPPASATPSFTTSVRPGAGKVSSSAATKPTNQPGNGYGTWWGNNPWNNRPWNVYGHGHPPRGGSSHGHGHGYGRGRGRFRA